ncbi:MAG: hypothetical protein ABI823_17440 [Bryobacteraceae bacterium]
MKPDLQAIFAKAGLNGECSGRDGDPLVTSSNALQDEFGTGLGDRRVSPGKTGGHYKYKGSLHTYLTFYLHGALRTIQPEQVSSHRPDAGVRLAREGHRDSAIHLV